jgi:hypothetical protein
MVSLLREHGMSEAWAIAVPASIGLIPAGRALADVLLFEHHLNVHRANQLILTLFRHWPCWSCWWCCCSAAGNGG